MIITNWNLVSVDSIIKDDSGVFYIIHTKQINEEKQICSIALTAVDVNFTRWAVSFPVACNSDGEFISIYDSSFKFIFKDTGLLKSAFSRLFMRVLDVNDKNKNIIVK